MLPEGEQRLVSQSLWRFFGRFTRVGRLALFIARELGGRLWRFLRPIPHLVAFGGRLGCWSCPVALAGSRQADHAAAARHSKDLSGFVSIALAILRPFHQACILPVRQICCFQSLWRFFGRFTGHPSSAKIQIIPGSIALAILRPFHFPSGACAASARISIALAILRPIHLTNHQHSNHGSAFGHLAILRPIPPRHRISRYASRWASRSGDSSAGPTTISRRVGMLVSIALWRFFGRFPWSFVIHHSEKSEVSIALAILQPDST